MKRIKILMTVMIVLSSMFWSCQTKQDVVKIGASLPLTGDFARYGIAIKNGIDLAYSESDIKNRIQLVYEDDKGEAKTAVTTVNKLLSSDNVDVLIGGASSSTAASIIPITSSNKKVLISPYATAEALFNEDNYFYSLLPSDSYEGLFMAEYLASQGIDSIGILYINNDYGVGIASSFTQGLQKENINILFSEGYGEGESNFRTQINKMKLMGVKAVYLPGYYTETSRILKQIKELGCDFKIFGSSNFYDPKFLEQSEADGVEFCYPLFDSTKEDVYRTFVSNYSSKYEQEPDAFAIQGYNSFRLIEKIILENELKDKIDFDTAMKKIKDFQGVNSIINFAHNGSAIKNLTIMEVKNGQFVKKY
jgi:branched-chain amino acid transport system substrate-binding protein